MGKRIFFLLSLLGIIWPSAAYNLGTTQGIVEALDSVYALSGSVVDFEKALDILAVEINAKGKSKETLQLLSEMPEDIVKLSPILGYLDDLIVTGGGSLSPENLQKANYLAMNFQEELENHLRVSLNVDVASESKVLSAFKRKDRLQTVYGEFNRLTKRDFMQSTNSGACVLYSFLYAAIQTGPLKQNLMNLVLKDRDSYYVRNGHNLMKIPFANLGKLKADMHPSSNPLLRALGVFANTKSHEVLGGFSGFDEYSLVGDGSPPRDVFFGLPVKNISVGNHYPRNYSPGDEFLLTSELIHALSASVNGSLIFGSFKYSGPFVLSIATTGHAISAFYDKKSHKWKIFDNQSGIYAPKILPNVTGITLIGDFKTSKI
jgi:hypothetical protein